MAKKPKRKESGVARPVSKTPHFQIFINEGSFFHEAWLKDNVFNKEYRYDQVPTSVQRRFAQFLRDKGSMNPEEARIIVDFVLYQ